MTATSRMGHAEHSLQHDTGPLDVQPTKALHHPSTAHLWRAFRVAPLVAPSLFAVAIFLLGLLLRPADDSDLGTPTGIILVPLLSLSLGTVASYVIAAVIGMPVVFALRRRQSLNGWSIHLLALVLGAAFCLILWLGLYACTAPPRPALVELLPGVMGYSAPMLSCILLSGTTFWWMIRTSHRG